MTETVDHPTTRPARKILAAGISAVTIAPILAWLWEIARASWPSLPEMPEPVVAAIGGIIAAVTGYFVASEASFTGSDGKKYFTNVPSSSVEPDARAALTKGKAPK